ncbi:hypothetical protein NC652_040466 [Populus alba x Populus x berolinensis]|nr:hypothetical protein NC652_040466 [Populus alba x Populus x berolinensis]
MCASQKPFDYVLHFINCFCSATQVGVQKPSKNWQEPRKFKKLTSCLSFISCK